MAQSSRGMMHLQYAHATCTSILRDGKTFRAIAPMIQRHNARLTRRFGAAKRRKIGRCAADCYSFYGQSSMKKSVSTFLTSYTAAELTPTP